MSRRVISAERLYPTPGDPAIRDGAVLVDEGGTIVAVGEVTAVLARAGTGVEHIALPGATLLPGLVNCHVHLVFDGGPDPAAGVRDSSDDALLDAMGDRARALLRSGVTTARDLGDRAGLVDRLRNRALADGSPVPRMLTSGAPLTVPGGHCWFLGGEVTGEASILDTVRARAAAGADLVKVMVSGGQLTPGGAAMWEPQIGLDRLRAVVAAAHDVGLPVAAHAHGTDSIADCVEAGVDTIEHCTWLVGPPSDGRYRPRDDLAAAIAERGIPVCPARSRNWPRFAHLHALLDRIAWMDRHGIQLIAGTDSGVPGSVFDDLHGALGLYRRAGLSAASVLSMATTAAAAAIGLGDITGRLRPGYRADLVAATRDPLHDLGALGELSLVVAGGRAHRPAELGGPNS